MAEGAPIRVTVVVATPSADCTDCFSYAEVVAEAAFVGRRLKEHYGDAIRFELIDLADDPAGATGGEAARSAAATVGTPVVLVNGTPRLSGMFTYRAVAEAIDTLLEANHG